MHCASSARMINISIYTASFTVLSNIELLQLIKTINLSEANIA